MTGESFADWLPALRDLLDGASSPLELLNHRHVRRAMRVLVDVARGTRAEQATQAFLLGAAVERERQRAWFLLGTFPCHDHLR